MERWIVELILDLTGSVYRLIFGKDIAVEGVVPGLGGADGRSNFQIEISIKNINQTTPLPITFYMVALTEGVLQLVPQAAVQTIAPIIDLQEVYNAPVVGMHYNSYKEMIGGGLWDSIKSLGATALQLGGPLALQALASKAPDSMKGAVGALGPLALNAAVGALAPKAAGGRGRRGGVLASGGRGVGINELRMIKQKRW